MASGIVSELVDEFTALSTARAPWEVYWRNIAMYVLPQTDSFDTLLSGGGHAAISSVVSTPVASRKSKDLYDMTSLWAIERLTAGMLSLKTPESTTWHDMGLDSYFGEEPTYMEDVALERLRNYLFRVRANPQTGFWGAHRAAVKSMCAFGDGWMFIEESEGNGAKTPFTYRYMPLVEMYPSVAPNGMPDRNGRVFRYSAIQAVTKFGPKKVPPRVLALAQNPAQGHETVRVMHMVRPRDGLDRNSIGVRGAAFQSHYCFPDDNFHAGESGYYEFPFIRYSWANTGNRPFSEGPIAYAIGELRSLQEMAKNELIAVQQAVRPAFGTAGKNFVKLNLNPGAMNPNMVTPEGRPLFAPLNTGMRPDFAQAVMESRRNSIREMLYLNLWQIIIQDREQTATEALIRAQEKGEMLGPVGISLNEGLSSMVEREVAILGRKKAFESGSPLEMPDSMADKDVSPVFTSPLDRLRRMGEMVGMQRLVEFATMLTGGDPQRAAEVLARFDTDDMLERAQEILGAPVTSLRDKDAAQADRDQMGSAQQLMMALQSLKGGGEAMKAIGEGGVAAAQGAESMAAAPNLQNMLQQGPGMLNAGIRGARASQAA